MSDTEAPTRARVRRVTVGTVPLLVDESAVLVVTLVQRTWTSTERRSGLPATRSPVAVEVRRDPLTDQGDAGGMSPAAARALSAALADAARLAGEIGTGPLDDAAVAALSRAAAGRAKRPRRKREQNGGAAA